MYRKQGTGEKMEKKKKGKRIAIICLVTAAAAFLGFIGFHEYMDYTRIGCKTRIYGQDISWKTVDEAVQIVENRFAQRRISYTENGTEVYSLSMAEAGCTLNEEVLRQKLNAIKDRKKFCTVFAEKIYDYVMNYQLDEQEGQMTAALTEDHFGDSTRRQTSQDAYIRYDNETRQYVIVDAVLGTHIDSAAMEEKTREAIAAAVQENPLGGQIDIIIDESFYQKAAVQGDQAELTQQLTGLNEKLSKYRQAAITYTFGQTTEVLDQTVIEGWLKIGDTSVELDTEAVKSYVSDLGTKYNTIYNPRSFHTSLGADITIENNEYGYWIDNDGEYQQLLQNIENGDVVSRDPVYSHEGFNRNGRDDLMGNYVEVDLNTQQLWLYRDGQLITNTGIVSGLPTPERETYRGAYFIAYKESPANLTSEENGYDVQVQYWMPFVYGQGLHDATWQSSFGGDRYKTNGSHGCVNLPKDQAALIFEYVDAGFPIILY